MSSPEGTDFKLTVTVPYHKDHDAVLAILNEASMKLRTVECKGQLSARCTVEGIEYGQKMMSLSEALGPFPSDGFERLA